MRRPGPDWQAWRHQPQPGCPRCDARHDGGPVTRLLPHHRYVCTRHRYWIGPPDAGQPATPLGPELASIVQAQRRHLRLLRRHGPAATYDAVLTGFLLCGHLWTDQPGDWYGPRQRWTRRAEILIPPGAESSQFSASRIFAAAYPEAVTLASLIASPAWRSLAADGPAQQQQFTAALGQRLGRPGYRPPAPAPDRALDEIRQLAPPAGRTPHSRRPADTDPARTGRLPPAGRACSGTNAAACGSSSTAAAAASSCTTATSGPSWSATGHARWTASTPPSGPARPRCLPGLTTT